MKQEAGIWMDYHRAVIVFVLEQAEEIMRITSNLKQDVGYADVITHRVTHASSPATDGDGHDRRFDNPLDGYLDAISAYLRDATSTLILGPGLAKFALQKRLEAQKLGHRIASIQTAAMMNDRQIVAAVRQYFRPAHMAQREEPPSMTRLNKPVAVRAAQENFKKYETDSDRGSGPLPALSKHRSSSKYAVLRR